MGCYLKLNKERSSFSSLVELRDNRSPTSPAFDDAATSALPPSSSPPCGFPPLRILPISSQESIFPHYDRRNPDPFCRDLLHFHHRDTQWLYDHVGVGFEGHGAAVPKRPRDNPVLSDFHLSAVIRNADIIEHRLWQK